MRIPIAASLESRDGTLTRDALCRNVIAEAVGEALNVRTRPGLVDLGLVRAGVAQMLYYWNEKVYTVIGDYLNAGTFSLGAWSSVTLPSSDTWGSIAYDGTNYAAAAINSNGSTVAMYSADGSTWTAATLSENNNPRIMIGGDGRFVCAGFLSGGVATATATISTDHGATWSDVTLSASKKWASGCHSGNLGKFLLIDQNTGYTALSSDGVTWAAGGTMPNPWLWIDVCWAPELSLFVAVAQEAAATTNIATSSDGVTWGSVTHTLGLTFTSVAWNGSVLCIFNGGANYLTSADGVTFTSRTAPASSLTQVRGDRTGKFVVVNGSNTTDAYWSSDGITWTASTLANSVTGSSHLLAANNAGQWIALRGSPASATANVAVFGGGVTSTETALTPTTYGLPFSSQDSGANAAQAYLMFKNATQAWTLTGGGTLAAITDVDYPGTYAVTLTSLTRSGSVATATTAVDTNFQVGGTVTIAGATPTDYNGAKVITGITASTTSGVSSEPLPVTITLSGSTATVTSASVAHGFVNGQTVRIAGAIQDNYNGDFAITWLSATTFSYTVPNVITASPATPATGSPVISSVTSGGRVFNSPGAQPLTSFWMNVQSTSFIPLVGSSVTIVSLLPGISGTYTLTGVSGLLNIWLQIAFTISGYAGPAGVDDPLATVAFASPSAVSSITSAAGVATVTTSTPHGLSTGATVTISGATQYQYNGVFVISVTGASTFSYTMQNVVAGSPITPATGTITATGIVTATGASFTFAIAGTPATPATGTITATGGRSTVPGIAYINGYFNVMDVYGVIYSSALDDPSAWSSLDYTTAQSETGAGVALARSQNYLVAFKEWSTEFFYDAKNPVGSPFSPVENAFTQIGCAQGWSVADIDGALLWISQAKAKGRSVHIMSGMEQQKVSSSAVDRILNADTLTTVHAYAVKLDGNPIYLLTLVGSGVTLAYNLATKFWSTWTSLTLGASKSVASITRSGTTATVTISAGHGLSDGDPVKISGATQTEYNGIFQASYTSATVFTIEVTGSPATPATGTILAYPYTESYFKFTKYANCGGVDIVLHESDGHLYEIDPDTDQDNAIPVVYFIRTTRLDGGTTALKALSRLTVIGDTVSTTAMIRWSDDDSATFSAYRRADLSLEEPMLRRCGAFRRRSIELKHVGNAALNLSALEMEIGG